MRLISLFFLQPFLSYNLHSKDKSKLDTQRRLLLQIATKPQQIENRIGYTKKAHTFTQKLGDVEQTFLFSFSSLYDHVLSYLPLISEQTLFFFL